MSPSRNTPATQVSTVSNPTVLSLSPLGTPNSHQRSPAHLQWQANVRSLCLRPQSQFQTLAREGKSSTASLLAALGGALEAGPNGREGGLASHGACSSHHRFPLMSVRDRRASGGTAREGGAGRRVRDHGPTVPRAPVRDLPAEATTAQAKGCQAHRRCPSAGRRAPPGSTSCQSHRRP